MSDFSTLEVLHHLFRYKTQLMQTSVNLPGTHKNVSYQCQGVDRVIPINSSLQDG